MKKQNILMVVMLLVLSFNIFSEKIELNLTKGSTYLQNINAKSTVKQSFGGQSFDMIMGVKGITVFEVKDIKDSIYEMDVYYKELGISVDFFGQAIEFSSLKNDIEDMTSQMLKNMTGKKFIIKMTKSGKITEVKNIEFVYENLFKGIDGIDEASKEELTKQMKDTFGEESFKSNMELSFPVYPTNNVKAGDKWTANSTIKSGFTLNLNTEYTLKSVNKESYVLNSKSTLATGNEFVNIADISTRYDLKGTMTGTFTVDKKTGWVSNAIIEEKISGDTFTKLPDEDDYMEMPLDMIVNMTITNK